MPITDEQLQSIPDMPTREEVAKLQRGEKATLTEEQINAIQDEGLRKEVTSLQGGQPQAAAKKRSLLATEPQNLTDEELDSIGDEKLRERVRKQQQRLLGIQGVAYYQPSAQEVVQRQKDLAQEILGILAGDDSPEAAKIKGVIDANLMDEQQMMNTLTELKQLQKSAAETSMAVEIKGRGGMPNEGGR